MNRTDTEPKNGSKPSRFALNDKNNLRILRAAVEKALAETARELGITVKTGNISEVLLVLRHDRPALVGRFEGDGTGCKVQLIVKAARYWRLFEHAGLKEEHLHAEIVLRGEKHELVGLMPNRSKFPIVIKNKATQKVILVTPAVLMQLKDRTIAEVK